MDRSDSLPVSSYDDDELDSALDLYGLEDDGLYDEEDEDAMDVDVDERAAHLRDCEGGPSSHAPSLVDDSTIQLKSHEKLVPGSRLAALFEALETNRAAQAALRAVMAKADQMIVRNWQDISLMEKRRSKSKETNLGEGVQAVTLQFSSQAVASTCFWKMKGKTPRPNSDSLAMASASISSLPSSLERTRWGKDRVDQLKKGIQVC